MKQRSRALRAVLAVVLVHAGWARAEATSSAAMRGLTSKTTVTRADCQRAAAALVAGLGAPTRQSEVVALLEKRHVMRRGDARDSGGVATRGYACLLFVRALGERGGVMRHLLPDSEHYAYRHLDFLNMIPAGGSGRPITGLELVSLLGLSRKRMTGRDAALEAAR